MANYVVSSDNINGKEQSYIKTVISKLEAKGHTCENAGVGPNTIQSYGLSSKAAGKIGVFIVGGVDAGMFVDFVETKYQYKYMWVVFASNTATTDKWLTCKGLSTTPLVRAHDDNYSGSNIASVGKTTKQYFSEHKDRINYVCGKLGCTFESIADKLANGGNEEEGESSASTIKDAICEVCSFWDGEVEVTVDSNKVKIRKIPEAEEDHLPSSIIEGVNVELNSISVQDYHPDTINFLTVHWQGGEDIVYRDEALIERFGEKPQELDAVKRVVKADDESDDTTTTSTVSDTDSDTGDTTVDAEETTSTVSTTSYEEVPVDTYEEALSFANTEWAKIRRNNGHEVELKVIGNVEYKPAWVYVRLYSYPTDMYMYIKSVSDDISENGEFSTNITLVDYPPSLGEWNDTEKTEEEDEETTEEEEEVVT